METSEETSVCHSCYSRNSVSQKISRFFGCPTKKIALKEGEGKTSDRDSRLRCSVWGFCVFPLVIEASSSTMQIAFVIERLGTVGTCGDIKNAISAGIWEGRCLLSKCIKGNYCLVWRHFLYFRQSVYRLDSLAKQPRFTQSAGAAHLLAVCLAFSAAGGRPLVCTFSALGYTHKTTSRPFGVSLMETRVPRCNAEY